MSTNIHTQAFIQGYTHVEVYFGLSGFDLDASEGFSDVGTCEIDSFRTISCGFGKSRDFGKNEPTAF